MRTKRAGQTLAASLIVIAIIAILAALYFMPRGGQSSRADGKGKTTVGAVMMEAKDTQCVNNLSQIRQLIYVQTQTNGEDDPEMPANLAEVRGLSESMTRCPIGKEPYLYDSESGKAKCPHPGHEKY